MLNNFIYAQTKDLFLEALGAGNILDEAIVFIEDTREIWNHGHYFGGETIDPSIISDLQTAVAQMQSSKLDSSTAESTYAKKTELPSLDGYLTENVANALYVRISDMQGISTVISNLQTEVSTKADRATTAEKEIIGELETVHVHGISNDNYTYALPDTANGDEDDILLSQQSVKTINGETIYGSGDISTIHYGVCDSAAATTLKSVMVPTLTDFVNGTKLVVKFTNASTAPIAQLQINNGQPKLVKWKLDAPPGNTFVAGTVLEFTFADDTWHITGGYQYEPYINGLKGSRTNSDSITNYGLCTTAAETVGKTVTVDGSFSLITGAQVVVKFTLGNTAENPTLNVNNTGAKSIAWGSYSGARHLQSGEILTFVYDGTCWCCKSSSSVLTTGRVGSGYTLQAMHSATCGLAISDSNSAMGSENGALYINATGIDANAVYCENGDIVANGGAIKGNIVRNTRTITATTSLYSHDNIILCNNASAINVNIKMDQVTSGQIFTIIKTTNANVTVGTVSSTGASVSYLRILGTNTTSASTSALSGIGVWNLYCIGDYIYLYKL